MRNGTLANDDMGMVDGKHIATYEYKDLSPTCWSMDNLHRPTEDPYSVRKPGFLHRSYGLHRAGAETAGQDTEN